MQSTNGNYSRKAILYARVSTEEQARTGFSLAQQIETLREYATREGYKVLEEVTDPGQSGASLERPGMDRVRDLVAAGGVSVVLAQDRDRFSREPAYHYLLKREFEEHGCNIRALNDKGDDSPEGELTDGILDQLAKYERAKMAERTRRGKLKKVREGRILANKCPDYGFKYNATRDGYFVDEETMPVVRRIFRMVGMEGISIRSVTRTLNHEGVKPPFAPWSRSGQWGTTVIRENIIGDDVYKPHTYEEIKALVAPEVADCLDPSKAYGVWWYNRTKSKTVRVSVTGQNGKEYKKRAKYVPRPREEWIAVPVPDSGIPREWVDAAREAVKNNCRPSSAGHRFWELSGGILRCGGCSYAMMTNSIPSHGKKRLNHYYRCPKRMRDKETCPQPRNYRADKIEPQVWGLVSSLMTDPEQLRADLERMIELERETLHSDPDREARAWRNKLSEVERQRSRAQDMAIEGLLCYDELGAKLAVLDETRKTAERELEALRSHQERIEELERDKDALLESYAGLAPEILAGLTPEECHQVYKMLRVRAVVHVDGVLEVSGALAGAICVSNWGTAPTSRVTTPSAPSLRVLDL
jgi:site-specific DNA recombinase